MKNPEPLDARVPLESFVINGQADHSLTLKELRCIQYLLCDCTVKEIAENLCSSDQAVYKTLERLKEKLSLNSYHGLAGWALKKRLILLNFSRV